MNLSELRDRFHSFINGGFPDTPKDPLCSSTLEEELAEVVDDLVKLRHDFDHLRVDRDGALNALATAEELIVDLEARLLAAETALHLAYGVAE